MTESTTAGAVDTRGVPQLLPLTAAQRGMWFADRLSPDYSVNVAQYFDLHHEPGALDHELMSDLSYSIGRKLEAPYIRLTEVDGVPMQYVDLDYDQTIDFLDFRDHADPEVAAMEWIQKEYRRPVNLVEDQLIVVALLRVADDRTIWYGRAHHLIIDGYAAMTMMRRFVEAYNAIKRGEQTKERPLASLSEIIEYENNYTESSRYRSDREHWLARVVDLPERTTLSRVRKPARVTFDNLVSGAELPTDVQRRLEAVAREVNSSLAVLMAAGFSAFLARMTDTDDVVLSLPVTGRSTAKIKNSGGMISNVLPIRLRDVRQKTIRQLLADALLELTGALRHQRYRSDDIRRDAGLPTDSMSFGPTINMVFFDEPIQLVDANLEYRILTSGILEDLLVNLYQPGPDEPLTVDLHGNPNLYTQDEIDQHHRRFVAFLDSFSRDIDAHVADVELLLSDDIDVLPPTVSPTVAPRLLSEIFGSAVERNPDGVAVTDADGALSYRELDAASNRLARHLIAQGIGPESLVAITIDRSTAFLTAIWAVTKTGAAYVPIDPTYPADRVAHMIADSGARIGLTVTSSRPSVGIVRWLSVDAPAVVEVLASVSPAPIDASERLGPVNVDNVAYVIYTSGSTGRPKGVAVTHRGLRNYGTTAAERTDADDNSRVLGFASPSFDASVLEYLMAATCAGTVVYRPAEAVAGELLQEFIDEARPTHGFLTPSVLGSLDASRWDSMESLMVGGEAVPEALKNTWAADHRILDGYGPTETTIMVSISAPMTPDAPVTIGRNLPGTRMMVLDRRLRPVPAGVPGGLYVSGPGLARGYHGNPARTASRFVADPCGSGTRMYYTGDVVRWSADPHGRLDMEYLGRSDNQIKLRGLRIELGEIETALAAHAGVLAVVVVGISDAGEPVVDGASVVTSLAAYLVTHGPVDQDGLRAALARQLPEYMIPATFTFLNALPLTPVGKLDRAALPAPDQDAEATVEFVPAATDHERAISEVLLDLLDTDRVGMRDNIFALGADSILVSRLVARVRSQAGLELRLADIFTGGTVSSMAAAAVPIAVEGREVEIRPRPERIPLSYPQNRLWILNRVDPTSGAYNVPGAVRLTGEVNATAMAAAIRDVVTRHESLRTTFPSDPGGDPYQLVHAAEDAWSTGIFESLETAEDQLDARLAQLGGAGFDLAVDLPVRVRLLRVTRSGEPAGHVLLIVTHHIVSDGASLGPLVRDVVSAYTARIVGNPPAWTPLKVQYADYTLWQRDLLGSPADTDSLLAQQIRFWREELDGLPEMVSLPSDRRRPPAASGAGAFHDSVVDVSTVNALRRIAAAHGVTLFSVFEAVTAAILERLTGEGDIAIGTAVEGRGTPELADLIGMFVNTVVLRHHVDPSMTFGELLDSTHATRSRALSNADVPFDQVVDALGLHRTRDHSPLFQVELVMRHDQVSAALADNDQVSLVDARVPMSKFDMTVALAEHGAATRDAGAVSVEISYATDLYDAGTIERFSAYFHRILTVIAAGDPRHTPLEDLLRFSDAELGAAVSSSVGPAAIVPATTLADLVAAQIAASPHAVALVVGDREIDYAEFGARVTELARHLIGRGVGPGVSVAIAMPRSAEMMIGIHAVVAAGGSYVPLDIALPSERIAYMCDTAAVTVALVHASDDAVYDKLPSDLPLICVDADHAPVLAGPVTDADRHAPLLPTSAAYTMFTSGSTGRPKGVTISHAAIANRLLWMRHEFEVATTDVLLHKTPITFDVSVPGIVRAVHRRRVGGGGRSRGTCRSAVSRGDHPESRRHDGPLCPVDAVGFRGGPRTECGGCADEPASAVHQW